ncbi:signal peptidase II [Entomoplasma ellychniae]|uniref:Lipoprotein signal peptidase n=2 Tax=Entomoplasma ellychniae TaxID=2114 RepID=A0A8E2QX28_9MOLU|nr:signal peptidase II [Entomoplasma ellychniae]
MILKNRINNFWSFLKKYNYEWKMKLTVGMPIIIILVALDWISKGIVTSNMTLGQSKDFLPGFLNLNYIINLGRAWGENNDPASLVKNISFAAIFTILILVVFIFVNSKKWIIPIAMLFSGAFANVLARSWSPMNADGVHGGVVDLLVWDFDFFIFSKSYIFNLADVWVCSGIPLMGVCFIIEFIQMFLEAKKNKKELHD